jgi:hypothetical protein
MATTLKTKNSVVTTVVPTTLAQGELAVNITDKKMWVGNAATTPVQILGAGVTNDAGGSNTQVQYNSSGVLAGSANMTFSGTALTLANDASISGLTVGKGGGAVANSTVVGNGALASNSTGNYNSAFGQYALNANTSDGNNAFGWYSQNATTSGTYNVSFGTSSMYLNTTGSYNVALGGQALRFNTTASNNTAVGYQAAYSNTTGTANTAVGTLALYSTTTTNSNSALGYRAMYLNTTGTENTAAGKDSLYSNTTGSYNTAHGVQALAGNTTASNNTATGFQAGSSNTTGAANVFLGYQAGNNLTTGSNNIYIGGLGPTASGTNVSYEIVIGNGNGAGSATCYINPASGAVFQGNNNATWAVISDVRLKKNIVNNNTGLDVINQIQVRNFEYRTPEEVTNLPKNQAVDKTGVQFGIIAQELQAICPDCVTEQSTGVLSVNTDELFWHLINAVKELNAKITALENK